MSTHARPIVLVLVMLGLLAAVVVTRINGAPPAAREFADGHVATLHVFNAEGELIGPVAMPPVNKTPAQWREILTPEQYNIVREAGTERAGTGTLLTNKADGVYTCVACRLPLFSSTAKFESGTGWPSFYKPITADNVGEHTDRALGMVRTEITCARCNGHLGHVFRDGPRPTGLRYCMNSAALSFSPAADIRSLADPAAGDATGGSTASQATAVIAGGCFWCVEAVFEEIEGVLVARSGYAGGKASTAPTS